MKERHFQLTAEDREYMLKRAVEHYTESQLAECEKVLRGLLALEPNDARAWQLLGSCLAVQGYRQAAEKVFQRVLELAHDDPYALAALAEIALDALRWKEAKAYLKRLFDQDPDGKHPAANRGRFILKRAIDQYGPDGAQ
jgi:predicted Zn-dependent protease